MIRLVDAIFAQHIANVELSDENAGIVQWVLSHTPTIDATLVVHGRWIEKAGRAKCSACADECWADSAMEYKYCPNCGSRMDGED